MEIALNITSICKKLISVYFLFLSSGIQFLQISGFIYTYSLYNDFISSTYYTGSNGTE